MVRLIIRNGEFSGEIARVCGQHLVVNGLLVDDNGVISDLRSAFIHISEVKEILEADDLEMELIISAREYQSPETTSKPETRPPRWLVRFKPPRLPAGYTNPRAVFMAKTPWGEAQAEATTLNLTAGEATVELSAQPLCGYITY
ncbi:MAG: hypothetical protein QXX29_05150, partial [Nitrososphaerota archaeon]